MSAASLVRSEGFRPVGAGIGGLVVRYGSAVAVQGGELHFTVGAGEHLTPLGLSARGKTTTACSWKSEERGHEPAARGADPEFASTSIPLRVPSSRTTLSPHGSYNHRSSE